MDRREATKPREARVPPWSAQWADPPSEPQESLRSTGSRVATCPDGPTIVPR